MTVRELRELAELAEAQLGPDHVVMLRVPGPDRTFQELPAASLYAAPPHSCPERMKDAGPKRGRS